MPTTVAPSADPMPPRHELLANAIRFLAIDAVEKAGSGHPGMPMGMADVATVLWTRFLKFDPDAPTWADRDRFVLSAGHGSMLLYSLLYLSGFPVLTLDDLKQFRQLGSKTPGHPEVLHEAGIEMTTGPLGQGLATSIGMALAERSLNARFGDDIVNHFTYVLASDGDLMEGISHEAASLAGHLGLGKLIVLWDDNQISIDGAIGVSSSDDVPARFRAYGWDVSAVDGHNPDQIAAAIAAAQTTGAPSLIACRTIIGFGAPTKAGTSGCHGSALGAAEVAGTREKLGWPYPAFVIPDAILAAWRSAGQRSKGDHAAWTQRLARDPARQAAFETAVAPALSVDIAPVVEAYKQKVATEQPKLATRVASGQVLELLVPAVPEMIGGSADLTPSNNTRTKTGTDLSRTNYGGRYIHFGIREHGMAAALNGMALHGGLVPYGGTFLTFSDYCRPAIRLAALMKQRVVFVMTHDSIGLGEDGPTHQPVEHIAALRAIPGLTVFRPADPVETAEAWQIAVTTPDRPSIMALTRQNLPTLRTRFTRENLTARGAYVLAEAEGPRRATLFATGSEVHLAVEARAALAAEGISVAVVSMPAWDLFEQQDAAYRKAVIGDAPIRVGIEAQIVQGWHRYIGSDGVFIGMPGFGESGAYEKLYQHFGITTAAIVAAVKARL
ncbi:MAG: transketolase [Azospirillaceae bacterium]|nr:transketolase [Azospirillaceae bacterium]